MFHAQHYGNVHICAIVSYLFYFTVYICITTIANFKLKCQRLHIMFNHIIVARLSRQLSWIYLYLERQARSTYYQL